MSGAVSEALAAVKVGAIFFSSQQYHQCSRAPGGRQSRGLSLEAFSLGKLAGPGKVPPATLRLSCADRELFAVTV